MPLHATRSDGADHPDAAMKSESGSLLAWARLSACSARPSPENRGCDLRDGRARDHGSVGGDALRSAG